MDSVDSMTPPALAGETCGEAQTDNPAGLRRWLVLHMMPRTEKKAMQRLSRCRGFHYLPLYVKVTRVQRRKVRRELPLFPGYVFAHLSPAECTDILRSNLVVRTILDPFPRETVRQLRQIARAARSAPEGGRTPPGKTAGREHRPLPFQGIFQTQGSNPGLWHCRRILYHLSHQGSGGFLVC